MHSKKNILREWHSYLETIVLAEKNEAIREASATIKKLNADEKIKMQCEAREQLEHDMASAYHHGVDVGEKRGMKLGEERGMKLGEERGRKAGIRAFVETCKELGIPEQEIAEKLQDKFDLSEQEVKSYIEKH